MRRLRSTFGCRLLVSLLVVSSLSALVAPMVGTAHQAVVLSYADWLRGHLDGFDAAAVDQALAAAIAADPQSFDDFLAAFAEAYLAQPRTDDTDQALSALALSKEGLIRHLERQFMHQVGDAVLPRPLVLSAAAQQGKALERTAPPTAFMPSYGPLVDAAASPLISVGTPPQMIPSHGLLTAAQPLGP